MQNIVLLKKTKEIEELCLKLGYDQIIFLEELNLIETDNKKELLKKIKEAKKNKKLILLKPKTEELLRYALEKTEVDLIYGQETINPKDSVHFVRGGLDQITCKIAAQKGKTIAFSFSEILNSNDQGKLLARISFNLKLCQKYRVKVRFSSFAQSKEELRSAQDLESFMRVLKKFKQKY